MCSSTITCISKQVGIFADVTAMNEESEIGNKLPVLQTATALAVSFAICKAGAFVTKYFGIPGGSLPAITAIVVILATAFPTQFGHLAPSGEAMALILMQVSIISCKRFPSVIKYIICSVFLIGFLILVYETLSIQYVEIFFVESWERT